MSMSYRSKTQTFFYKFFIWPLEAIILYFIYYLITALPFKISSLIMGNFFRFLGPLLSWNKRADNQLRFAIPKLSLKQRTLILREMWENLGRTLGEFPHTEKLFNSGFIEIKGIEKISSNYKSYFIVGAHLGNWETLSLLGNKLNKNSGIVYRKLNNPIANRLLLKRSKNKSFQILEKGKKAANGMLRVLKNEGIVFILADQQLREGISVPFFGKPANTSITHIKLAHKLKIPIFLVQSIRLKNHNHQILIKEKILVSKETDIPKVALRINQHFEKWILENPEQWLWPHRRWGKKKNL